MFLFYTAECLSLPLNIIASIAGIGSQIVSFFLSLFIYKI